MAIHSNHRVWVLDINNLNNVQLYSGRIATMAHSNVNETDLGICIRVQIIIICVGDRVIIFNLECINFAKRSFCIRNFPHSFNLVKGPSNQQPTRICIFFNVWTMAKVISGDHNNDLAVFGSFWILSQIIQALKIHIFSFGNLFNIHLLNKIVLFIIVNVWRCVCVEFVIFSVLVPHA